MRLDLQRNLLKHSGLLWIGIWSSIWTRKLYVTYYMYISTRRSSHNSLECFHFRVNSPCLRRAHNVSSARDTGATSNKEGLGREEKKILGLPFLLARGRVGHIAGYHFVPRVTNSYFFFFNSSMCPWSILHQGSLEKACNGGLIICWLGATPWCRDIRDFCFWSR